MSKYILLLSLLFLNLVNSYAQPVETIAEIDSLLHSPAKFPFNGVVLITKNGHSSYLKMNGYSNIGKKKVLKKNDQFVIGSISKQITAVLVLREYDAGHLQLHVPIRRYLPDLKKTWADTVTVHQLLTHTHGIIALDKPLIFIPGTKYDYSQIGFELLRRIVEKTSGTTFAKMSEALFKLCKMKNSFHPELHKHKHLVKGYALHNDEFVFETHSHENYVAAGGFISSPHDMMLWNNNLFGGRLLSDSSFKLMVTKHKNAIRDHPLFGKTAYGYGITINTRDSILQWGQTGFAPGFASMNFYFPETATGLLIFENTVLEPDHLKETFFYHLQILKIVRRK